MKKNILKQAFFASLGVTLLFLIMHFGLQFIQKFTEATFTVRGIAEHEVKSDLVHWTVEAKFIDEDIELAVEKAQQFKGKFFAFCKTQGIEKDLNLDFCTMEVQDNWTKPKYEQEHVDKSLRYRVVLKMIVESKQVDKVCKADANLAQNIPSVALSGRLQFYYTKFDYLREQMVQESFQSAYKVAHAIAQASSLKVGRVKNLSQGLFTILGAANRSSESDWDEKSSLVKVIRTVSTVTFSVAH